MNFSSYSDFRSAVLKMLDGDDISQSDLGVGTLDLIIASGERRIYRDIRSTTQIATLSLTVSGNLGTLPSDFIEMKGPPYVSGFLTAVYCPTEAFQNLINTSQRSDNHAIYYNFVGDSMTFWPAQASATVTGLYYKKFADIASGLNTFFNRHPDLFLYASLAESAPFLGEMTRLPIWEQKYQNLVESVNEEERRRATRGSKLQTRVA